MEIKDYIDTLTSIDFETTGLDDTSEIVEVGINGQGSLVKPLGDIPAAAAAVHGITRTLIEKHDSPFLSSYEQIFEDISTTTIIGHGIEFDIIALKTECEQKGINLNDNFGSSSLCTLTLMKKIFRNSDIFDNFKLGYIFFMLGLEDKLDDPEEIRFHRAGWDSKATLLILEWIIEYLVSENQLDLNKDIYEQLRSIMDSPVEVIKCPFGKHKGTDMDKVPVDYWIWCIQNTDMFDEDQPNHDADFAYTVFKLVEGTL